MARIPIPPQQVMPPEGVASVTQQVDTAGQDALSPTTQVLNYLKARGYTPSTENVRRALEANQRDPGVIGGLRSDTAATEADDQAAMAAARGGGANAGGGAGSRPLPIPPIPPTGGAPNTSAPPAPGGGITGDLGSKIIAGLGAVLPSALSALLPRSGAPAAPGGMPAPGVTAGAPQLTGPIDGAPQLPAPPAQLAPPPPGASPTGDSITKALEPPPGAVTGVAPVGPGMSATPPRGPSSPTGVPPPPLPVTPPANVVPQMPPLRGTGGSAADIPTVHVTPRPRGKLVIR